MATYPADFLSANQSKAKTPNVVFVIDGVSTVFTLSKTFRDYPVYGDPIDYGDTGLFYGQPYVVGNAKPYISDESSLIIGQKIEPEQGRGSTTELTIVLIDKNREISELISPGVTVEEILGRECLIYFGYQNTNYPDDYFVVFRGYITNTIAQAGKIRLTISDATQKKRQGVFSQYRGSVYLPMRYDYDVAFVSTYNDLPTDVVNLNNAYDSALKYYLKIADEFINFPRQWPFYATFPDWRYIQTNSRGARGTVAKSYGTITFDGQQYPVTFTGGTNLVNWTGHPFKNGMVVSFSSITTTTGISTNTAYFVRTVTANTFQISDQYGGAALAFTTGSGAINLLWIDYRITVGGTPYTFSVPIPRLEYFAFQAPNMLFPQFTDPYDICGTVTLNSNLASVAAGGPNVITLQLFYSQYTDPDGLTTYAMTCTNGNPNEYKFVFSTKDSFLGGVGYPLELRWFSGPNASRSMRDVLGFINSDNTGANIYAADNFKQSSGEDIAFMLEFTDHPMNIACSIMLSGWGGPFITDQRCTGLGTANGTTSSPYSILLPPGVDAKRDYGLTAGLASSTDVCKLGDMVTVTGSVYPSTNNTDWIITNISAGPDNDNQVLTVAYAYGASPGMTLDTFSGIRLAFRSKYDRLPKEYGLKLSPKFVDVEAHELLRDVYLTDAGYRIAPLIQQQQAGKEFIESQCYLPFGCYAVTKFGRLSVSLTKPPLAGGSLVELNSSNIINPQNITVTRGLNNRRFFNQVQYQYNQSDTGRYFSVYRAIDTDSLNRIGLMNILPINSTGVKSSINGALTGSESVIESVAQAFLNRFGNVAFEIRMTVNLEAGSRIEAGDIVQVADDGTLGITNLATGTRDLGVVLFEVIDRTLDMKGGYCNLTLLSNVGFLASDRFGVISPSSLVDNSGASTAPTTSTFGILPSFGSLYGADEWRKWTSYVGQSVIVYSQDWTVSGTSTIAAVDIPTINYPGGKITLSPALAFTPGTNYTISLDNYSTNTNPAVNAYSKQANVFLDPTVTVTNGVNETTFDVALVDASKFLENAYIYLHNVDYTRRSPTVQVKSVNTLTGRIVVRATLNFVPQSGDFVELIGFPDGQAGYMFS